MNGLKRWGSAPDRIALVSLASSAPMGQQAYEENVASRAQEELGPAWRVRRVVVRSLRSPLPGTTRLPARVLASPSLALRAACGAVIYRGSDVVHRLDLRLPPAPHGEVLTVHDVVPWRFPDEATPPQTAALEARAAAIIICPSAFSAEEIRTVLGTREPVVIPNGVDEAFFQASPADTAMLDRYGIRPPFVLHAGGCSLRKNLDGLAQAWKLARQAQPEASLVLIGPPDQRRDRLFASLPGTVILGRVPSEVVPQVMAAATIVVVPSLYEGFGLPALEAMAAGVPVVAANRSALPEVCGDAAVLVDPSGSALAAGLVSVLEGGSWVSDLVARGRRRAAPYTWAANVAAHADIWRSFA